MRAYEINGQQWRVDVETQDGSRAQTVVTAQTRQQAGELAKRYYRGKNLRVRVISAEPEPVEEQINPDTVKPGFKREKRLDANIRLVAQGRDAATKDGTYGLIIRAYDDSHRGAWPEIGMARLILDTNNLDDPENFMSASFLHVDTDYRRRGIATAMYNFARELGNEVRASNTLSYAGQQFWKAGGGVGRDYKKPLALPKPANYQPSQPAKKPSLWDRFKTALAEVRSDDSEDYDDEGYEELKVSQRIQKYFTDRGYGYLGEGRDQMAFLTPRGTVLKILGIGEDEREDIVKTYVGFFMRNQRNPHYPRIYNAGDFAVDGETYFLYEMEYLHPVSGEERVLEYIEDLMDSLGRGEHALQAFYKNKKRPPELSEEQVRGLVAATQALNKTLGGQAPLDLRSIENLGRRDNGQIVIIDPFSL